MVPVLTGAGHRVVCPDYPGFGCSDKPTELRWYGYDRFADYTAALLRVLDLRDATVVVQHWGGPIGLRWAVESAERVARLVILNTGLFTGRVSKGFLAWQDFARRNPDLPVGFVLQGATGCFPIRAGQVFCDLIPGAGEQVRIEGATHFLQEDRGERIAEEIVSFLER